MAIFEGDEMIDVPTPDGRVLRLPRSAVPAGAFPTQPGPVPVPFNDGMAGAPGAIVEPPQSVTGGQMPTDNIYDSSGAPVQNSPDFNADTIDIKKIQQQQVKDKAAKVKADKAAAVQAKKQAAQAATPQGQLAAAQGQQNAATQEEAGAIVGAADVQAAEDAVLADAYGERNKQINAKVAARQNEMFELAQAEDAKMQELLAQRKKIASTKIDRSLDHPVLAAIMAGLAGIGQAMNQKAAGQQMAPTVTMEILYKTIDRKVAAQEADLDLMAKAYGMSREELNDLKDKSKRKLEFHNILIAGETDKAVRTIEEITARSASDKTKANAKIMIAQLNARAADKTMEATRWGLDYDQKDRHQKQQIQLGYANLGESKRHNMAGEQLQREQIYADLQKALSADKARGDEATFKARMAAAKDVRETGLKGVDNDYLLTPTGRAKMDQAQKYESEAQQLEEKYKSDPMGTSIKSGRVELLRQKAAELRGDARSFDVVQARDANQAGKMSDKYAAAQAMMDTVDEIKMLYNKEGRKYVYTTKGQAELQAKMGLLSVKAKDAWQLGAWDKGSAKLVADIIGGDPTDAWDAGAIASQMGVHFGKDPEGFKNRLDAVTTALEQDVKQQMVKNSNWDGKGELFTRKKEEDLDTPMNKASADLTQARTGVELQEKAENVGTAGKVARAVGYPFSPNHQEEAENAQSIKYPGLSLDQEEPFETLVTAYKKGDKRAGDELVAKVINASKDRPELATALMHNLYETAPNLYTAARAGMPKDSDADKQMTYEENNRIGAGVAPTAEIATMVINTLDKDGLVKDEDGYKELARRAAKKDPVARQALMDIQKASSKKKDINTVPPWAGGR